MSDLVKLATELERQKKSKKDWSLPSNQIKTYYDVGTNKINNVASEEVEEPILVVNNVVKNYNLGKDKAESLLKQFSQEGFNRWGLVNSVTAVAQTEPNYEGQIEMEKLGTKLLTVPMKELTRKTED